MDEYIKVEIDLPKVDGYEYTGEYRGPKMGEYYCDAFNRPLVWDLNMPDKDKALFHILRKVQKPDKLDCLLTAYKEFDVSYGEVFAELIDRIKLLEKRLKESDRD
jgi:hypothetical protein